MWWYFISGLVVGSILGIIGIAILTGPKEPEQDERKDERQNEILFAYKQGYRDALRKVRGLR